VSTRNGNTTLTDAWEYSLSRFGDGDRTPSGRDFLDVIIEESHRKNKKK
jgi:hypothetical protein